MSKSEADKILDKIDLARDKKDFIDSLNILNDFGNQFFERKEYDKCAIIDYKILCSASRILGLENPDTLRVMENLAVDYSMLGKKEQAISTYEDLIKYRKRISDGNDEDTVRCMTNLARLYAETKNKAKFNAIMQSLASQCYCDEADKSDKSDHVVS